MQSSFCVFFVEMLWFHCGVRAGHALYYSAYCSIVITLLHMSNILNKEPWDFVFIFTIVDWE